MHNNKSSHNKVSSTALVIISIRLKGFDKPTHLHPHKYTYLWINLGIQETQIYQEILEAPFHQRAWIQWDLKAHCHSPPGESCNQLEPVNFLRPAVCLSVCSALRNLVKGRPQFLKSVLKGFLKAGRPLFLCQCKLPHRPLKCRVRLSKLNDSIANMPSRWLKCSTLHLLPFARWFSRQSLYFVGYLSCSFWYSGRIDDIHFLSNRVVSNLAPFSNLQISLQGTVRKTDLGCVSGDSAQKHEVQKPLKPLMRTTSKVSFPLSKIHESENLADSITSQDSF